MTHKRMTSFGIYILSCTTEQLQPLYAMRLNIIPNIWRNPVAGSYIYFKFLGVHSFLGALEKSAAEYILFKDDFSSLYSRHREIIAHDDTITAGMITGEGQQVYFTEVGIRITKSYRSFFVYFFDHHPTLDDMNCIVLGLETVIQENLNTVDPSEITGAI